ncbi:IS630 family transposase [Laspinema olomoucense]|uniref:IS630 family transposase n=1 Tax=Laspinema olomoucense D3b TaxID=2953688 RepID=A0ABT2NK11_9CYAN|nr:IS630 family transposase [Laspinema sp. D3b]MCT7981665.1 IS630 family transposase [Laspinema sp. D3b]
MKPYSLDFRQKIVQIYEEENQSIRKIAARFGVAKSFVQKILKQSKETGDLTPKPQGGNTAPKLGSQEIVILMELIENNNDATLQELCDFLEEKIGVKVSTSTLDRVIKKLGYTFKKKTLHAEEKFTERVQKKRVEFWEKIRDIPYEDLIFIDESGVDLALIKTKARAIKGQRALGTKPQKRGKRVSLLTALSLKKVVASTNIYGTTNQVTFEAFIVTQLIPNLWKNACVVMDNASIHTSKIVEEAIQEAGAKLIYLSPYSPEFSPIENFWSKVKEMLKKFQARTYADLVIGITEAMRQVTQQDIRNWFAHCCYCTS